MARERGIIFSGPMVRAILDGRKTQTRRVMRPQPWKNQVGQWLWEWRPSKHMPFHPYIEGVHQYPQIPPFGNCGGKLWVRETWQEYLDGNYGDPFERIAYRASKATWPLGVTLDKGWRWRPSIHMPRCYSRITLEITGIRVERLQEISEADCEAEGLDREKDGYECDDVSAHLYLRPAFYKMWNEYAKMRDRWSYNPWVWVIEFKRIGT